MERMEIQCIMLLGVKDRISKPYYICEVQK